MAKAIFYKNNSKGCDDCIDPNRFNKSNFKHFYLTMLKKIADQTKVPYYLICRDGVEMPTTCPRLELKKDR